MAIYSLHVKMVSRSAGRSVVAAAAYRAGESIGDDRLGVVWDFTRKSGVLHAEIIIPAGAPEWAQDRAELWNAAERAEDKSTRRSSAATGRDIILALPHELSHEQRIAAVRSFAQFLVDQYGVAVDFAIHAPDRHSDDRNYHAHLLMTTRRVDANGFGAKTRVLDDFKTGPREIEIIRKSWEQIGNRALREAGLDIRIDCRSYVDQGLDREPTVHLGPVAAGMERNGDQTDLGDRNRSARANNAERERLAGERDTATAEIIDLAAERKRREEERDLRSAIRTQSPPRILDSLTERRATFTRADLNRALAKVILNPQERGKLTDQVLALPAVIGLKETADALVSRYTTKAVLASEQKALDDADALAKKTGFAMQAAEPGGAGERRRPLKDEQHEAVRHATQAGAFAVIAGEAGTGKSTVIAAVRERYEAAGFRVIGMSWTNAVVQDMRKGGFREAATIASELWRLEHGTERWDRRTVLILDEAAMLSTKHLSAVLENARAAGAKVILTGDDRQLASIERGGLFGALKEKHGAAELHEVVRVSDAAQKRAFNLMHKGEFMPALRILSQQGAIDWSGNRNEAVRRLTERWRQDSEAAPDKSRFVFAYTNADVGELNGALRQVRAAQGALGPDHILITAHGPAVFAVGDRIQFTGTAQRRDERKAGLVNGGIGTIRSIEDNRVTVGLDGTPGSPERVISFAAGVNATAGEYGQFRHGYAGTIYKGQGKTLDETYLYHSEHWRSASGYVALTRHRSKVALFVSMSVASDLGQLAWQMARVDDCRAASQFVADYNFERPTPEQPRRRAAAAGASREAGLDPETLDILREARETEAGQAQEHDPDLGWERSR